METHLSGILSVGGQQYAVPLSYIDSIESSYEIELVDELPMLKLDDKSIVVYDLDKKRNVASDKRRLCVIIGNIALMADEFQSKQLDAHHYRALPNLIATGVIDHLYFNHPEGELIQVLDLQALSGFLIGSQETDTALAEG